MARVIPFLTFVALLIPLFFVFDNFAHYCFRFEPAKLQAICKDAVATHGENVDGLMRDIVHSLQAEHPGIIEDFDSSRWVFNVAGGATVSLASCLK